MKTMIYKGDRILWIFISVILLMFAVKISNAQTGAKDVIKVKISGNGFSDETFIRFKEGASESFEGDKDAWKMFSINPGVPMIFSRVDGYAVSLNTFPLLNLKLKMELFTKISVPGNYSIVTKIISPFSDSVKIFMLDKLMNEVYNIGNDSAINVYLPADSGNNSRFQLYFSTPAKYSSKSLTCFKNQDGQIIIENLSEMGWEINISDENNVYQKSLSGASSTYIITNLHGGNFIVSAGDIAGNENHVIKVDQPYPLISSFVPSSENECTCDGGKISFYNNSIGAASYSWEFGDGNKSSEMQMEHIYTQPGEYIVSLAVSQEQCNDTSFARIKIFEPIPLFSNEIAIKEEGLLLFDGENYIFRPNSKNLANVEVEVLNILGQKIPISPEYNFQENEIIINTGEKTGQVYLFRITTKDTSFIKLSL